MKQIHSNPLNTKGIEKIADKGILQLQIANKRMIFNYELKPYFKIPQQFRLWIDNKPTLFIDFKEFLKLKIKDAVICQK